jgi:aspartate kinase
MRGSEPLTEFEKPRGVSRVEIRDGFAQVQVDGLGEPEAEARIEVVRQIAEADVSLDFLKLTPNGLSFLVPESSAKAAEAALANGRARFRILAPRSIVMVHAVNMRDEEGLIARIVSQAIGTGLTLEHLGDMHDRILIVLESGDAKKLAQHLEDALARREK